MVGFKIEEYPCLLVPTLQYDPLLSLIMNLLVMMIINQKMKVCN